MTRKDLKILFREYPVLQPAPLPADADIQPQLFSHPMQRAAQGLPLAGDPVFPQKLFAQRLLGDGGLGVGVLFQDPEDAQGNKVC